MKRRDFIGKSIVGVVGAIAVPTIVPSSVFGKNAPSNKINVGQIGCGRIARDHDLPGTMQHEIARLVAVCDLDKNRLLDGKKLVEAYYTKKTGNANYVDVKKHNPPNDNIAGVVGTIQTRKNTHVSICKALENRCNKVLLFGDFEPEYFKNIINKVNNFLLTKFIFIICE
jgi:hypothetical protein